MKNGFKKEIILFFILILSSLFLLFLDKKGFLKPIRSFFERPVLALEGDIFKTFSSWRQDDSEFLRLQTDLQRLAVDQNELNGCREENEKMRKLLGAPLPPKWQFLPAKVVGIDDQMRLDKGQRDGVQEGMMVISENILVGRVTSTTQRHSVVEMPISPGVKIPVAIKQLGRSGIQARGLLTSEPGGGLILDRVLQEEDIRQSDLVVTSGEGEWLSDLVIGQIEEVMPKTAELYKKARVRQLADYRHLTIVFVITDF